MNKKGFTLIELIIAVTIIAILSVIGMGSYRSAQQRARDARRIQDMKNLQTAAEEYYTLSDGSYPTDTNISSWTMNGTKVLEVFPIDPLNIGYSYSSSTTDDYCACAKMESNNLSNSNNTNCNFGTTGDYYCVKNRQ